METTSGLLTAVIVGEAWANIGAVQMKLKNWSRAYDALQEAQKHKPREWRIIENLMMATLEMRRSTPQSSPRL
jgi:cytochrome c-type biogenesis protein CcmH/NrfG